MRIQQVDFRAKQVLEAQNVVRKRQVTKRLNQLPEIQVESQKQISHFLNDDVQKTLDIIIQMKNQSSNSLKDKKIQQQVIFSSGKSQVVDILLIKPEKQSMKRSMKRFLKKMKLQKIVMPNLLNLDQVIMDLLIFQQDYIETKTSHLILKDNLLSQAESIFLKREAVEQEKMERQKQKLKMMIIIEKTIEHLSKPLFLFSAMELSKAAGLILGFKLFQRNMRRFTTKGVRNSNLNESQLHENKLVFSKQKYQEGLNKQISIEERHISLIPYQLCKASDNNNNNQVQQYHFCYMVIAKASEQAIILGQQLCSQQCLNNSEKKQENNNNKEENQIQQTLKYEVLNQFYLQYDQKSHNNIAEQCNQLSVDHIKNSIEFIQPNKRSQQKKSLKDYFNMDHKLQQLHFSIKLKSSVIQIQISDQHITIYLAQMQKNILLNLIKQKKIAQVEKLLASIIYKQDQLLKQNSLVLSNNNSPESQENNSNLIKQYHLTKHFFSSQTQTKKQIKRFNQLIPGFGTDKIFNEDKLLGGGCGSSKINVAYPQNLKEHDQQKLKSDKFFDEHKYADESQFGDFMEIYNKYYTNNEINHEVLENRIRTIIETLHKQCEHIFSLAIRPKVIELINLLINYYMIAIQKNDTQTLQKFIDKTEQELKDLKETSFQNRKKYPCLDLCQYFELLICLNQQRQGIDKINQSQALKIAEIILKLVKFGAGFTSIFGAIDTLSKIQLEDIQKNFQEIKQVCVKLFEYSQGVGQQALEQYTSYSIGSLSNKIMAIWLRKIQSLGDDLRDEHQQIIFYLKEINEIQNNGNNEIVLFVYMQLNYLLQKKQKDDNLKSFTILLNETKQENLIFDFINYLQFKSYSTTLFENAKKLLDTMVTSEQFRQLKISLLLKFSSILENFNDKKQEHCKLMIHLCMAYLQENEISVKIIYKGNQRMKMFIQNIEKYTVELINESKESYQTMKIMIQNEEQLNKIANKIESKEDVAILLAKTYVQMWEASVKQRQEQKKIAHKDDTLLEVIQLYIKQKVTYLQGNTLIEEQNNKNKDHQIDQKDALQLIIDKFLIPNFVQTNDKWLRLSQNKSEHQPCKILSILAEGGSGKSMILKKLEVELLKGDSEYIKDERAEYIPFIIKCNSLDIKQPSIEEYLLSQNLSQSEIELLKKSERNKLIMLDGYDEYTGDYFKVYQKLQINNWVNTLVIVTSRLERISVSDAKLYFNYYDEQGKQGSKDTFSILKLEKIKDSDIKEYLEKYKEQQRKIQNFNEQQHNQFEKIIFQSKNKQLIELLKLPINLYLTTRMAADLDLTDQNTLTTIQEASDQVEIQELFFQQQFNKQSQTLFEQKLKLSTNNNPENDGKKQELINILQSCYFEYFQTIAMQMFLQKGKKTNFLSTKKSDVMFKLRDEVLKYLNQNKIKNEDIIQNVKNFIDSRVITRIQLSMKDENTQNQQAQNSLNEETLEFEFRHKSLFEYFTARAMKYDFDLHRENLFKLSSFQLSQFNINKRIIMSSKKNASEQQILLKFYKLIKPEIDSSEFKQNYSIEDISKTNRYIQFLKKSTISDYTQTSQIDVGSSNLLSTLFISKFSFPNLIFKNCSFSQAYISKSSRKVVEFQDCNLENALIEKQHLEYFESSNTKTAIFNAFQQQFNTDDIYSFSQVIFYKNNLVTITDTGFINFFEVPTNKNQSCKKLFSNQITNAPLKTINLVEAKNIFVVTAQKSIFEVNPQTLKKVKSFTFSNSIASLSLNNSKYVVTLSNNYLFYGDIENGFKPLDKNKIQSDYSLSTDDFIVVSSNNQIDVYNLKNLQIIKTNLDPTCSRLQASTFSADGKYLATSSSDKTCKIWNAEKEFELINTIENTKNISLIAFSADSKYLVVCSKQTCKIYNVEKQFELINQIEDSYNIVSAAFSTDGKYLTTGSSDKTCKIWNIEKGFELLNTIQGTSNIYSAVFSTDGKYLATGSKDKTCNIWNVERGFELINTIQGHNSSIYSVAFSSDGKYLATGSEDKSCKIWHIKNGFELLDKILGHDDDINSVAFSADGTYLATGSSDTTCKIWNVEQGFELIHTIEGIEGHTSSINSVAFSTDGKYLATGSSDDTCKIWNVENGFELLRIIEGHDDTINLVTFSTNGKYLATGSEDKTCKIWNVENQFELINTIRGHYAAYNSLTFSADGTYLAIGSSDSTCKIWNVEKGFELINSIEGHTCYIYSVAFSSDGKYLATGSEDKSCKIWNLEKGFETINEVQGHNGLIQSVAFSNDGKYLATGSWDKTCKIWNVHKGFELTNIIQGYADDINSVAFSANGKYLAVGSSDNICRIFSVEKGFELMNTIQGHTDEISSVSFSVDGKFLATGSYDTTCKIWNVDKEFELIYTIQGHTDDINSVAFSADGKYLVTGSEDKICKIWNVKRGFELIITIQGHTNLIKSVAFSADGKYLATGSEDKTCKLWNVEKGFELIYTYHGHNDGISSVSFSADGKYLITCSYDKTCKIWNVENGFELINIIQVHTDLINSVAFSTDGKYLATGSSDKTCKIWNLQKGFEFLNKIQGHTNQVLSFAFSADGKYFRVCLENNTYEFWNAEKCFENLTEFEIENVLSQFVDNKLIENNTSTLLKLIGSYNIFAQIFEV